MNIGEYMKKAIAVAEKNSTPYGCVLLNTDEGVFFTYSNTTRIDGKTAHAEMNALSNIHRDFGKNTDHLVLFSTAEPCPMCMSALIWSGIQEVYYGLHIEEILKFHKQITISAEEVAKSSWYQPKIEGGWLHRECMTLFQDYA